MPLTCLQSKRMKMSIYGTLKKQAGISLAKIILITFFMQIGMPPHSHGSSTSRPTPCATTKKDDTTYNTQLGSHSRFYSLGSGTHPISITDSLPATCCSFGVVSGYLWNHLHGSSAHPQQLLTLYETRCKTSRFHNSPFNYHYV